MSLNQEQKRALIGMLKEPMVSPGSSSYMSDMCITGLIESVPRNGAGAPAEVCSLTTAGRLLAESLKREESMSRELCRIAHGKDIEGDGLCPVETKLRLELSECRSEMDQLRTITPGLDARQPTHEENQMAEWDTDHDAQCTEGRRVGPIGLAVRWLRQGKRVTRQGWRAGKYLEMQAPGTGHARHDGVIFMTTSCGCLVSWLTRQDDILATDWTLAE